MLRKLLLLAAASLAAGVPLPKHAAHGTGKRAPASSAAAEADLITDLPGAPKDVGFKQYAGEMGRERSRGSRVLFAALLRARAVRR